MKNKPKKQVKSFALHLLSGKKVRLIKKEVVDVSEQYTIWGGYDVIVCVKSGKEYLAQDKKEDILVKISK